MRSIEKKTYEYAMAVFYADPIIGYKNAIKRHQKSIKILKKLIKKLESKK